MVEIIARGKDPKDQQHHAQCNNCGTFMKFKRSEARFVADQRDGDALVIDCPVCSKEVWVNPEASDRRFRSVFG